MRECTGASFLFRIFSSYFALLRRNFTLTAPFPSPTCPRDPRVWWLGRATKRYLAIFVIAILTGAVAASITSLSRWLTALKLESVGAKLIQMETDGTVFDGAAFLALIAFNLVCVFGATCVVAFGETVAAGSGIPEIKCILNGVTIRHATRFKTLVFKVVGVILSVAGGLPVGKEGPMIHSGSIVGSAVSQGKTR